MKREIEYQAWDSANAKMLDWDTIKDHLIMPGHSGWEWREYTGIRDKKGNKIYEGDILECEYHPSMVTTGETLIWRGTVVYSTGSFYVIRNNTYRTPYSVNFSGSVIKRWEVIGNRFESPDLLEAKYLCGDIANSHLDKKRL